MKIAHITNTLFSIDFMIGYDQLLLLKKSGHEVVVLTDTENRVLGNKNNSIFCQNIGFNKLTVNGILTCLFDLRKSMQKERFDIIITHTIEASFFSLLAACFNRSVQKVYCRHGVAWLTGNFFKRLFLFIADLICCMLCDEIVDVSRGVATTKPLSRWFASKSNLLGEGSLIGVNIPESGLKINSESPLLLGYVSRLTEEKGILSLIRFAELLKSSGLENRIILFGPRDSSTNYIFPNNIDYRGVESDKNVIYNSFDILLNFSQREGLSTVVIEAGAYGIPTIGFDVIGIRDCVKEGQTGYLVKNVNDAMSRLAELEFDMNKFKTICQNARLFVQDNFDRQEKVKEFIRFLNISVN